MGSPLFITSPVIAQAVVPTLTVMANNPISDATLIFTAVGPTLIESLEWAVDQATLSAANMAAGQIGVVLFDGATRNILTYVLSPAWTGDEGLHGALDLALALPAGWSLYASHDITTTVPADINLTFTARGGVIG